jgi:nucleotide-binding universal stress UspA family protein
MRRILVAVDGSEPASHAVVMAAKLAAQAKAELLVANVRVPLVYPVETFWVPSPELEKAQKESAEAILTKALALAQEAGVKPIAVRLEGSPAESIAAEAEKQAVDLVVVGSRGRGKVARVLLGSVADRLVHICQRPVLVTR